MDRADVASGERSSSLFRWEFDARTHAPRGARMNDFLYGRRCRDGTSALAIGSCAAVVLALAACSNSSDSGGGGEGATPAGFVRIPAGNFQRGEVGIAEPVHLVTIRSPFWMGAKEVTQAEYAALMGSNPSYSQGDGNLPVEQVSWFDARSYCAALHAQQAALGAVPSGYEYRLPTEAEWEYACRAGTTTSWNVGDALDCSQTNHYSSSFDAYCVGQTSAVGSHAPNAWGLFDMHGNVYEWCLDSYGDYPSSAATDPFVTGGPYRVLRGGSWDGDPVDCRSAFRSGDVPGGRDFLVGFRVVLAPVLVP